MLTRDALLPVLAISSVFALQAPASAQPCQGRGWELQLGPRSGSAMAYDSARGVTVLFGGALGFSPPYGDTWEWDGNTWIQRATQGPSPRWYAAMAYDSARGVTVLFGGTD